MCVYVGELRQRHPIQLQVESDLERHGLHQDTAPEQAHHLLHRGQRRHPHVALLPPQHQRLAQAVALQRRLLAHAEGPDRVHAQRPVAAVVAHAEHRQVRRVRGAARRNLAGDRQAPALLLEDRGLGLRRHRGHDHQRHRREVLGAAESAHVHLLEQQLPGGDHARARAQGAQEVRAQRQPSGDDRLADERHPVQQPAAALAPHQGAGAAALRARSAAPAARQQQVHALPGGQQSQRRVHSRERLLEVVLVGVAASLAVLEHGYLAQSHADSQVT